ncbi:hypothetical protein BT96DRAFT_938035 [Gymnopus androsaceus JB14]|uniref:Uncharacterized protein n=1 Tax=Gymnopus androsaceus JB14 TaxID=1447944 RepID=A0A6A4HT64_9AGAR|nr:hypothetical protein BT96DRAFT_938035 [Gymnopus androsaceus JB14]
MINIFRRQGSMLRAFIEDKAKIFKQGLLKGSLLSLVLCLNNNGLDKPITVSTVVMEMLKPSAVTFLPCIIVDNLDHLGISGMVNVDENADESLLSFVDCPDTEGIPSIGILSIEWAVLPPGRIRVAIPVVDATHKIAEPSPHSTQHRGI